MAIPKKIKDYLDKEKVAYQLHEHGRLFTAAEIAGAEHVPGKQMIKVVIVEADDQFLMCLLPATHYLDLDKFQKAVSAKKIRLANEQEMSNLFPDCEIGSEPPFGSLYNLKVFADKQLQEDTEVAFNAGSHNDLIKMKYEEFLRLASPNFLEIGVHI